VSNFIFHFWTNWTAPLEVVDLYSFSCFQGKRQNWTLLDRIGQLDKAVV
jgi:hypothetical protein